MKIKNTLLALLIGTFGHSVCAQTNSENQPKTTVYESGVHPDFNKQENGVQSNNSEENATKVDNRKSKAASVVVITTGLTVGGFIASRLIFKAILKDINYELNCVFDGQ